MPFICLAGGLILAVGIAARFYKGYDEFGPRPYSQYMQKAIDNYTTALIYLDEAKRYYPSAVEEAEETVDEALRIINIVKAVEKADNA